MSSTQKSVSRRRTDESPVRESGERRRNLLLDRRIKCFFSQWYVQIGYRSLNRNVCGNGRKKDRVFDTVVRGWGGIGTEEMVVNRR